MPVEPRGLALDMQSQMKGEPLGQKVYYGATETLFSETEALPQGETGSKSATLSSTERAKLLPAPDATGADISVIASRAGVLCVRFGEVQGKAGCGKSACPV